MDSIKESIEYRRIIAVPQRTLSHRVAIFVPQYNLNISKLYSSCQTSKNLILFSKTVRINSCI